MPASTATPRALRLPTAPLLTYYGRSTWLVQAEMGLRYRLAGQSA
jgi:hypothetical protein